MREDAVLDIESYVIFKGYPKDTLGWLEENYKVFTPLWVSVGETGDLLTSSEYMDLAS